MTFEPLSDRFVHRLERSLAFPSTSPIPTPTPTTALSSSAPLPASSSIELFLSDVPDKPLTWLWPGRIPLGHLTLLDAAPGSDPSLLALTLAASLSSGKPLPGSAPTQSGTVILFAPRDSASATIKPRLQAAGGDPARVLLFRPPIAVAPHTHTHAHSFALSSTIDHLSNTIRRLNARLVIFDPVSMIPGLLRYLPALSELAQQTSCAILLIRSLSKPPVDLLHSSGPTSPLQEVARSRLLLSPDPTDERQHLLITTWHPLCTQPSILTYDLLYPDGNIPAIHWLAERDRTHLARLSTAPLRSLHRQAILRFLHESPTPQTIPSILAATSYDDEAGRKMLIRMKMADELVCPARGLYTTANHPSLSSLTDGPPPVSNVPTAPETPSQATGAGFPPLACPRPGSLLDVEFVQGTGGACPRPGISVSNVPTTPDIPSPAAPEPADSHLSPVPNVTNPADTTDVLCYKGSTNNRGQDQRPCHSERVSRSPERSEGEESKCA